MPLLIKKCKEFAKTYERHKNKKQILVKLADFIKFKPEHPGEPFGGKDYPFAKASSLSGYAHTGLTSDISLFYKIENGILKLYGIYSHDEAGIGQPASNVKQKSLANRFSNQVFEFKQGQ